MTATKQQMPAVYRLMRELIDRYGRTVSFYPERLSQNCYRIQLPEDGQMLAITKDDGSLILVEMCREGIKKDPANGCTLTRSVSNISITNNTEIISYTNEKDKG